MNVSIVYVYPTAAGDRYRDYAARFLCSYHTFGPGHGHETIVVLNGGGANSETHALFASLPGLRFIERGNSGYDIGAFQQAARECSSDLVVFFGTTAFLNGEGWLKRMVEAFERYGNSQYGAMGNRGDLRVGVYPHIRTTAFWMPPALMRSYPKPVTRPEQRFPFEHGPECLTTWLFNHGVKSWVVTWKNVLPWERWDDDPNGYHRGDQSGLLAGDRMNERPYYPRQ